MNPSAALEHQPEAPLPSFAKPDSLEADCVPVGQGSDVTEARATSSAPRFATDAELAQWAIANPDALHPTQVAVLIDCVNDPHDRQLLIDHGVDVTALTDVLRRAA